MSQNTAAQTKNAVSRKDMTKLQWTWKEMKRNYIAYVMVAPFMILFTLFTVVPVVLSIFFSFTDFNLLQTPNWVGIDNYIRLFLDDDIFLIACQNTFIFAGIVGPASYFMSLFVAWFINELSPKIRAIVTLVFYAPSISGEVYTIWGTLFSSDSQGWVNGKLLELRLITKEIKFFEDAKYVMPLCIVVALWISLGTAFLSFIAGLQGIDRSYYEAGAVDGIKNRWQELWYITLPSMKPQLMFGAVMAITGAFNFGGVVESLAGNPTTDYCAYTLTMHLNEYSGVRWEVGYASAIAFIMFLLMFGSNMLIHKLLSKVGQ